MMSKKKIRLMFLVIVAFLVLIIFPLDQASAEIITYKIAYIDHFYPFQYKGNSGPEGFVIELLHSIAAEEKLYLSYEPMNLNDAVLALEKGSIDGIADLKYTAELDEKFDFSEPFTTVSHSLIVREENQSISSLPDLGTKVVAVERGDEGFNILRDIRSVQFIIGNNQEEAFQLLEIGRADAFVGNTLFSKAYLAKNHLEKQFKMIDTIILPSDYAFATREENHEFLKKINNGLLKVRANQDYSKIYNKWFGWENNQLEQRLKIAVIVLLFFIPLVIIQVFNTTLWNKRLKEEVYNRTVELEKTNQLLKLKMEEEKRLRNKLVYKEKMQTLGQLVSGIAHELRNPLTSIKTFVELIPFKLDNERFREEIVAYVPGEINRLNQLVSNLLDYAKPQEPKKIQFQVRECLGSVLTLFQVQLKRKAIEVYNEIDPSLYTFADYNQIKQVFINLLINASDAIKTKGEIRIISKEEKDWIQIEVVDTGIGIAEENLPLIFEPFYTNKPNGTGLGLPLSLQYLKENGGDLTVVSKAGLGTKAVMILPKGVDSNEDNLSVTGR